MSASINSDSSKYAAGENGHAAAYSGYAPSVPISVYRELATELKTTQTTLDALSQQNQQLLRQNQLLRAEIQRFVQAAEQLGHFAGVIPARDIISNAGKRFPVSAGERTIAAEGERSRQSPREAVTAGSSPQPGMPETLMQPVVVERHQPGLATPELANSENWVEPTPSAEPATVSPAGSRPEAANPSQSMAIVPQPKERKRSPKGSGAKPQFLTEQPEGMHPLSRVAARAEMSNLWLATTILLVVVSAFGAGFLIMRPLLNNR